MSNAVKMKPPKPLTEEEKKMQLMRFFATKREQFAVGLLNSLCQNPGVIDDKVKLVDIAVEMADHLVEKLYPVIDEKKEESHED